MTYVKGNPALEGVMAERERISRERPPSCGTRAILANCGFAGATFKSSFGVTGGKTTFRPVAD